ncbi:MULTISPECIES: DUF418 domain-containing protein [Mammaliicoccus]|uniref:DUF418 domain-containing protein n=1 Tax=Mammaliicoccus fleurettii TaxID=150056 RepID=A0ABS5MKQ8_9STAP|nr:MULTISPECIES: DUF418 domain-containing protein [Mammaliicoccus]HCN61558.1 DUF418 domain-containing protein [Staphylococcus sp.]MBL0847801.1 DUF418 domain-containing protein [Mammaliicoccus fleurettii]MBO3063146.1 DUF418 domain-containing protein [Mammaliicoccus fleurettii]MBS3671585.1 DUF418 domain-containing protein [Mammaliicoccus fleurettii]MBS3696264.1 DUF418 domain-containing protein [Mammaliicoccus fleurettii]
MAKQRIFSIDALRGFSLLGILLMNILTFAFPYQIINPFEFFQQQDGALFKISSLFIIASFYPIFAFLFGYGLSIMYQNSIEKELNYYPMIIRRLSFLLLIGMIHGIFIFYGDILATYALLGFIAIIFVRLKPQHSLVALTIGFGILILLYILPMVLLQDATQVENFVGLQELERVNNILASADYLSIIGVNLKYFGMNVANTILVGPFSILPIMLFGIYAHQINWLNKIRNHKNLYTVIGLVIFILGLAIKMIQIVLEGSMTSQLISQLLGGPIVALSYIIFFVLLCEDATARKVLNPLQYIGKLSLTTYLTQSIICIFIFYGIGLNYYGKLPVLTIYTIAIVIYLVQLLLSYLYLKKFKQGPIEKLWRKVTYLK